MKHFSEHVLVALYTIFLMEPTHSAIFEPAFQENNVYLNSSIRILVSIDHHHKSPPHYKTQPIMVRGYSNDRLTC